jgi:hypothetical protein
MMMKSILLAICLALIMSCHQISSKSDHLDSISVSVKSIEDSVDFCTACDSLSRWQGGIQGIEKVGDSTGIYPFAECHTNRYFDLIWVPRGDILRFKDSVGRDSLYRLYDKAEKNNFREFDCYSFIIPKTKPGRRKRDCDCAGDDFDYIFPSNVKVFKRTDNGWALIKEKKIMTFNELGRLKLNTIFHIDY